MPKHIIIADTSCLILLDKIEALKLLRLVYHEVTITPRIAEEYQQPLPDWIKVDTPNELSFRAIAEIVDEGEASAIALSLEKEESTLILDDLRARKYAKSLNLHVIGTIGVIAKAQKEKKIASAMPMIEKIQKTNFRLSDKIVEQIRQELGD